MNTASHHLQMAADVLRQTYPNPAGWSSPAARAFHVELDLLVADVQKMQAAIEAVDQIATAIEVGLLVGALL
ncbi:MAG: hypothetical protein RIR34_586 [Actinomycetota bacterium]|jgi:hypothetical protein